jgi:16S rRNA (cytosine967-C5)-methyltransferase
VKTSSLLGHAAEALRLIREGHRPADGVVAEFFRDRRYLGARDRREIAGMVFGTLRHIRLLDLLVQAAAPGFSSSSRPDGPLLTPLLVAAYVLHVERDDTVETSAGLTEYLSTCLSGEMPAGIIAALKAARVPAETLESPVSRIAAVHSFPDCIIREWIARMGPEETEELAVSLNQQAPLSIRVNTLKSTVDHCRQVLAAAGVQTDKGTCSPFALILPKRLALDTVQAYRDGLFEMQDEGSQLLSLLLQPQPGTTVVDACAGGGGKTLHLAALMENRGRLVAIDTDERKLRHLTQRAERAGARVHMILSADRGKSAIARLHGAAHGVLVDAPCSAIGTVRRNPSLKMTYTEERSIQLSSLQAPLLDSAAALVMQGGRLVYSTCTLVQKENEDIAARFLENNPGFVLQPAYEILSRWGIAVDRSSPYLQLYPHRSGTDGFFAAVFLREVAAR